MGRKPVAEYGTVPERRGDGARALDAPVSHDDPSAQATLLTSRDGETLGVLSTYHGSGHPPPDRDLRLLDLCARQAGDLVDRRRADEALRASEAPLTEESQNKDEYLAILGHELRNPLGAIRAATQLIEHAETEDRLGATRLGWPRCSTTCSATRSSSHRPPEPSA